MHTGRFAHVEADILKNGGDFARFAVAAAILVDNVGLLVDQLLGLVAEHGFDRTGAALDLAIAIDHDQHIGADAADDPLQFIALQLHLAPAAVGEPEHEEEPEEEPVHEPFECLVPDHGIDAHRKAAQEAIGGQY